MLSSITVWMRKLRELFSSWNPFQTSPSVPRGTLRQLQYIGEGGGGGGFVTKFDNYFGFRLKEERLDFFNNTKSSRHSVN